MIVGVVLLVMGCVFYVGILLLLLNPANKILIPLWEIALIGCFCGLWMHAAVYVLAQNFKMDAQKFATIPSDEVVTSTSVKLGTLISYLNIFEGVLWLLFMIVAIIPFALSAIQQSTFALTPTAIIFVVGIVVYGVILRPIVDWLMRLVKKMGMKNLASFTFDESAITIDLNIRDLSAPSKKFIVKILFDELDEVRSFNYYEAQAFMTYEIGPSISLAVAAVQDEMKYLKGEIPRPNYYALNTTGVGHTLFLHGPKLLYLIVVQNLNCDDLVQAFNEYKSKKAKSVLHCPTRVL